MVASVTFIPQWMMDDLQLLGSVIRELRRARQWTQEDLAERADLHRVYLANLERGKKNVTYTVLLKILVALDTSFCDFACACDAARRRSS